MVSTSNHLNLTFNLCEKHAIQLGSYPRTFGLLDQLRGRMLTRYTKGPVRSNGSIQIACKIVKVTDSNLLHSWRVSGVRFNYYN